MGTSPSDKVGVEMPSIYMLDEAAAKQDRLIASVDAEVAWFGLCSMSKQGNIVVTELIVPEQTVSSGAVDYSDDHLHKILNKFVDEGREEDIPRIRYFGHSHYTHGAYFSSTDLNDFIVPMSQVGMDYFVCHVQNKRGDSVTRLDQFKPYRLALEVGLKRAVPGNVQKWVDEQLAENVTMRSYTSKSSSSTTPTTPSTPNYVWTTEEIKNAPLTVAKSIYDAKKYPRAVHHNMHQGSRHYFEGGVEIEKTELDPADAATDWSEHHQGAEKVTDMFKSKKEEKEGKVKDPPSTRKEELTPTEEVKLHQTQAVSDPKSDSPKEKPGEQRKRQPEETEKSLQDEVDNLISPDDVPPEEFAGTVEKESDSTDMVLAGLGIAPWGLGWWTADDDIELANDRFKNVDTDDIDDLKVLSDSELAELANEAALSELSDRELLGWGLRRNADGSLEQILH